MSKISTVSIYLYYFIKNETNENNENRILSGIVVIG